MPVTAGALRSLINGPAFQLLSIEQQSKQKSDGRALAIIGSRDPLLTHRPEAMLEHISAMVGEFTGCIIPDAVHDFDGVEDRVAEQVLAFILPEPSEQ